MRPHVRLTITTVGSDEVLEYEVFTADGLEKLDNEIKLASAIIETLSDHFVIREK